MSNILILGANSDIAKACAVQFAKHGCNLVLASRRHEKLNDLQSEIQQAYGVSVAVAEFDALAIMTHEDFYARFRGGIDVVILCFGYLGNQELAKTDQQECAKILNTNYFGAVSVLNFVADDFKSKRRGVIIGLSSVAGDRGRRSNYFYGSAKAGLTAYLSGLRSALIDDNVHVSTVIPGYVKSKMTAGLTMRPMLVASPESVAKAIYYKSFLGRRNVVYVKGIWRWMMLGIKLLPEPVMKRMRL